MIDLQAKLLEEERKRAQQDSLITAMASDYRSVYYVNLDENDAVCYKGDPDDNDRSDEGVHFSFTERFGYYAKSYVAEEYRDGREFYEMLRMAGVRPIESRTDHKVHAVGVGFTNIDKEMREEMAKMRCSVRHSHLPSRQIKPRPHFYPK